jgi:hypothetical protein
MMLLPNFEAMMMRSKGSSCRSRLPPWKQARGTDGLIFFGYLRRQRPHLLEFKMSENGWQIVHELAGTGVRTEPPLTRADANLAEAEPDLTWLCRC